MAGFEPRKDYQPQVKQPYVAPPPGQIQKDLKSAMIPPTKGSPGVYAPQTLPAPGAPIGPIAAPQQPPALAPQAPLGMPTPATTGAVNAAFSGAVQPPPLKTAGAAIDMTPMANAPAAPAEVAPPPLAGYAKMGGQEYKIGADGQATKYVNGQAVGDPAKASFTQAEVENGRMADAERNAKTLAANEAYRRDTHIQSELMRAAEQNNPQNAAMIRAAALQGSQQQVELDKQSGMDAAATQAAAAKGAALVQAAQVNQEGANARTDANNKGAMDRTKVNQKGAAERAKLAAEAAANKPQKPLVMMDANGAEQAYVPNLQAGTLQPLNVQTAPARTLPQGVDAKSAFSEAKAYIAQNPWAKDQVRARLQEYGLDPTGLDNG
jgi:hypothetical protein